MKRKRVELTNKLVLANHYANNLPINGKIPYRLINKELYAFDVEDKLYFSMEDPVTLMVKPRRNIGPVKKVAVIHIMEYTHYRANDGEINTRGTYQVASILGKSPIGRIT